MQDISEQWNRIDFIVKSASPSKTLEVEKAVMQYFSLY